MFIFVYPIINTKNIWRLAVFVYCVKLAQIKFSIYGKLGIIAKYSLDWSDFLYFTGTNLPKIICTGIMLSLLFG